MRRFEFWKLGLQNVIASAMRSGLTILGMSIGVAAILAVLTLGDAGQVQVRDEMERLGINQVQVTSANESYLLRASDGQCLRDHLKTTVDEIRMVECDLQSGKHRTKAIMLGCDWNTLCQMAPSLADGSIPDHADWMNDLPEVLVGQTLAEKLHLAQGQWFSANGKLLRCKGVVNHCQQATSVDVTQAIIAPTGLVSPFVAGTVQQLSIHVPSTTTPDEIAQRASQLLSEERSLPVNTITMQVQMEAADSILYTFVEVLRWVAFICMLVGGIGVANILLVSVRERRREIGVMQALGATEAQICGLFLCEALIYAVTGGILGLLGGGVLVAVAGKSIDLTPVIKAGDCTLVFFSAVLLGLLAGVAPALSASRMKPVDALKDD